MLSVSYFVAQLFGTVAFGFQTVSGQAKDRNRLTLFLGVANLFWVAHYVVLGVPLAAIISCLIAVQLLVSTYADVKHRRPIIIVFILLYWVAAYITFGDPFHLLPALGSSIFSISLIASRSATQLLPTIGTSFLSLSLLSVDSAKVVRIGIIVSFSMWMAHGFVTGSVIEVVANGIPLAAAVFGLLFRDFGLNPPDWVTRIERRFRRSDASDSEES